MPEVFTFREGQLSISTGDSSTSAIVAYARNTNVNLTRGWYNTQSINGVYRDHQTGRRADGSIEYLYTPDATIIKMMESATAIHLKLMHSGLGGTGGLHVYTAYIDSFNYRGTEAQPYTFSLSFHSNRWSAF